MHPPLRQRAVAVAAAIAASAGGAGAALLYHRLGLTLSHYDARGHLVVARRIIDSITPGWQQIGAVWLPLPHLLNALPVQIDAWYRSGASAVAFSILAFAIATGAIAWIAQAATDSSAGALAAAAVFALNPNVIYLQSTPMTEPLLLALSALAVAMLMEWTVARGEDATRHVPSAAVVGWTFVLACTTRYEAWLITACALGSAVWARWRSGRRSLPAAFADVGEIARYPAAACVAFIVFSRIVVGRWFVSEGFFVAENKAFGRPILAAAELWWGVQELSGPLLMAVGAAGLSLLLVIGLAARRRSSALIALSMTAAAGLPWVAFAKGHPFRIRYMVPLIAAQAVGAGTLVGAVSRLRIVSLAAVLLVVGLELRPLDLHAPMVVEAQWDQPNRPVRDRLTTYLRAEYRGEKIMVSMGSLGHYMQDASRSGFAISDFLHEGNGDIWLAALEHPRPFVGWILIEEKANGGDLLARTVRGNPHFLDGFSRVAEGAGLTLYRRLPERP